MLTSTLESQVNPFTASLPCTSVHSIILRLHFTDERLVGVETAASEKSCQSHPVDAEWMQDNVNPLSASTTLRREWMLSASKPRTNTETPDSDTQNLKVECRDLLDLHRHEGLLSFTAKPTAFQSGKMYSLLISIS